jgi:hypothetical protein
MINESKRTMRDCLRLCLIHNDTIAIWRMIDMVVHTDTVSAKRQRKVQTYSSKRFEAA